MDSRAFPIWIWHLNFTSENWSITFYVIVFLPGCSEMPRACKMMHYSLHFLGDAWGQSKPQWLGGHSGALQSVEARVATWVSSSRLFPSTSVGRLAVEWTGCCPHRSPGCIWTITTPDMSLSWWKAHGSQTFPLFIIIIGLYVTLLSQASVILVHNWWRSEVEKLAKQK